MPEQRIRILTPEQAVADIKNASTPLGQAVATAGGGGGSTNVVILDAGASIPSPATPGTVYLRLLSGTTGGGSGSTPDTTAPSAVGTITVSNVGGNSFRITWVAATDNVAVQNYQVRINGGAATTVASGLTHLFTGLTPSTSYTAEVRAKDFAGNFGPWSSVVQSTTSGGGTAGTHSIFGTSPPPTTVGGFTDGPVKVLSGFYTLNTEGMDVMGARVYVPAGLASGFYSNGIEIGSLVRNHTIAGVISGSEFNATTSQGVISAPLQVGWNEILFPAPIHVNPYAAGTQNAIWLSMKYQTVPYYLHSGGNPTGATQSATKPGIYLADQNFPRGGNNLGGTAANGTYYPIDIMVAG